MCGDPAEDGRRVAGAGPDFENEITRLDIGRSIISATM
jgi:hypothetical protein